MMELVITASMSTSQYVFLGPVRTSIRFLDSVSVLNIVMQSSPFHGHFELVHVQTPGGTNLFASELARVLQNGGWVLLTRGNYSQTSQVAALQKPISLLPFSYYALDEGDSEEPSEISQ
jgi:hypothetical protein